MATDFASKYLGERPGSSYVQSAVRWMGFPSVQKLLLLRVVEEEAEVVRRSGKLGIVGVVRKVPP